MRRAIFLGVLISVGALSLAVAGFQGPPQGPPSAAALAATKIEKVKDNLYMITGSGAADFNAFSGGNVAVFITDRGVVLVDAPHGRALGSMGERAVGEEERVREERQVDDRTDDHAVVVERAQRVADLHQHLFLANGQAYFKMPSRAAGSSGFLPRPDLSGTNFPSATNQIDGPGVQIDETHRLVKRNNVGQREADGGVLDITNAPKRGILDGACQKKSTGTN